LQQVGVSSAELENLIHAALAAGAEGAKLCGAGQGGNMVAVVAPERAQAIEAALLAAGARHTILSVVEPTGYSAGMQT
jgi:mevalonate kinase